jgi:membrane protein implicated in regulation of membrane protease activity
LIAHDPLSLVFIFCFLLGFGFFLLTALLGSHGHGHVHVGGHVHIGGHVHAGGHIHMHAGHHAGAAAHTQAHGASHTVGQQGEQQGQTQQGNFSLLAYLNPTSIGLFFLGFGLFGYFFHNLANLAASLSLVLAIVSGIVLAFLLLSLLNRLFANVEGSTEQDVADRTGILGRVSLTIPEKGIGEIIYTSPGGLRKSIPARGLNDQRVERDQEVVVVNYQNGVAEVDTWEHFMHEEAHTADSMTLDEMAKLRALLNESGPSEIEMIMRTESQKE